MNYNRKCMTYAPYPLIRNLGVISHKAYINTIETAVELKSFIYEISNLTVSY